MNTTPTKVQVARDISTKKTKQNYTPKNFTLCLKMYFIFKIIDNGAESFPQH